MTETGEVGGGKGAKEKVDMIEMGWGWGRGNVQEKEICIRVML